MPAKTTSKKSKTRTARKTVKSKKLQKSPVPKEAPSIEICHKFYTSMQGTVMLAACDKELLGKTFEDKAKGTRLHVCPSYYGGETLTPDQFAEKLKRCHIANLVGKQAVGKAIEAGYVLPQSVIKIKNVPHAQYFGL